MTIYDANSAAFFTVVCVCGRNLNSFLRCHFVMWLNCAFITKQYHLKKIIVSRASCLSPHCAPSMSSSASWQYFASLANCT